MRAQNAWRGTFGQTKRHNQIRIPHTCQQTKHTTALAVMRNRATSDVQAHREIITRRRARRASCIATRRSAFENLQVTDLRASPCVSRFAACFIGTRAKTSTAESGTLSNCCVRHSVPNCKFVHHVSVEAEHKIENNDRQNASANDPSAGSPTETLLRLLLPLSDKVH